MLAIDLTSVMLWNDEMAFQFMDIFCKKAASFNKHCYYKIA